MSQLLIMPKTTAYFYSILKCVAESFLLPVLKQFVERTVS